MKKLVKKMTSSSKRAPAEKMSNKAAIDSKTSTSSIDISSEERLKMISIAAYHKAEQRGFAPGGEIQDWAEAEQEIDEMLMSE